MYGQINRAQKAKRLYQARAAVQKMERAVADFRRFTTDASGERLRKDSSAVDRRRAALADIKQAAHEAKAALEPIAKAEKLEDVDSDLSEIVTSARTEQEAAERIAKRTAAEMIAAGYRKVGK
ncbi:MAG: hypothetical protein LAO05_06195 [Acidobacteriia bacterium]|nr:hypothetical protein [Terriglobia bacterium]